MVRRAGELPFGYDAAQVRVAFPVGGDEHALLGAAYEFGADYGPDARRPGSLVEEDGPVEAVRVGQRHGGHAHPRGGHGQFSDSEGPL